MWAAFKNWDTPLGPRGLLVVLFFLVLGVGLALLVGSVGYIFLGSASVVVGMNANVAWEQRRRQKQT
jgi:hypothetical protein